MSTNVKYARILKDHTVVVKKNKTGRHTAELDFKAGPDPVPVTRAALAALTAAGAAEEVRAPAGETTPPNSGADGKKV